MEKSVFKINWIINYLAIIYRLLILFDSVHVKIRFFILFISLRLVSHSGKTGAFGARDKNDMIKLIPVAWGAITHSETAIIFVFTVNAQNSVPQLKLNFNHRKHGKHGIEEIGYNSSVISVSSVVIKISVNIYVRNYR